MCLFSFQSLAEQVTDEELKEGRLYPPLSNIREVSIQISIKVRLLYFCSFSQWHFHLNERFYFWYSCQINLKSLQLYFIYSFNSVTESEVFLFPCRWWSMFMLKEWRSVTPSPRTRIVLYVVLCGTRTTSPSCLIPTTGRMSALVLKQAKRSDPYGNQVSKWIFCFFSLFSIQIEISLKGMTLV